jgi:hypothetical protein
MRRYQQRLLLLALVGSLAGACAVASLLFLSR